MGQTNCCSSDLKQEQVDIKDQQKMDEEKIQNKEVEFELRRMNTRKKKHSSKIKGLALVKQRTSNLLQRVQSRDDSTQSGSDKAVDEKDPDTFIPEVPELSELNDNQSHRDYMTQARKKAIEFWYEAKKEQDWTEHKVKDRVYCYFVETNECNRFYVKRVLEVNCPLKIAVDYFHNLDSGKAPLYNCGKLTEIEDIGHGARIIRYTTKSSA